MKEEYWILDSFGRKIFGPFETYEELQIYLPKTGNYRICHSSHFGAFKNATFDINLNVKKINVTNELKEKIEEETYDFLDKLNKIAPK